jgi:hypothetical protein
VLHSPRAKAVFGFAAAVVTHNCRDFEHHLCAIQGLRVFQLYIVLFGTPSRLCSQTNNQKEQRLAQLHQLYTYIRYSLLSPIIMMTTYTLILHNL